MGDAKKVGRLRWIFQDVKKIPVANTTDKITFTTIVNKILAIKNENSKADTSDLEKQINQLVYQLYGLTPEEIQIVESSTK
ncbi:MAG: class I SAM-dependent DNA methyltransferase [Bacteroidota bacterium]|nr:class I SAM-dependent DNA methyltransferase [Bacteroidota bacterium]